MIRHKLSAEKIRRELEKKGEKTEIIFKEETDSTNADIKRAADALTDKTVVIAREQTAGRGRMGRSFYSKAGSGLFLSMLLKSGIDDENLVLITTAAAVAVSRGIEAACGIKTGIKWVNDLFYNQKKVCGILAETVSDFKSGKINGVVLGVGINCGKADFPSEIRDIAGTIGDKVDKNRLAAEVIYNLCKIEELISSRSFIDEYKKRSIVLGKEISVVASPSYRAVAVDIDASGGLVIKDKAGDVKTLSTGEISIRLCN